MNNPEIPDNSENNPETPENIPDTQEPSIPDTQEPSIPETQEPSIPETQEPSIPETQELVFEHHRSFCQLALIFYSSLILISWPFLYWREGTMLPPYLWGKIPVLRQLCFGFSAGIAFVILSILASYLFPSVLQAEYDLKKVLEHLSWQGILLIAICSGIGEEFFFRGVLQPSLGIWITSILFGMVHPPLSKNLIFYPFVAAGTGWILGWLFITTGSLIPPAFAHFTINLINLYRINKLPVLEEGKTT